MSTPAAPYTTTMVQRARELRENEWPPGRIAEQLGREFGQRPSRSTVDIWTDPKAAAVHRARGDRWNRRKAETARLRRVSALRAAGLSQSAIRKVIALDFGEALTEEQMRRVVAQGTWPRRVVAA